eukprot:TRINITY_DN19323_c0_g1_i1.p1 TRINITY_DN19323_c0_g1~~TRINITY_DN19323_c0_g1_i1.p1  ORF type:complete len:214 (+),score=21.70 TRINITY_DN19323_c0_g1_i1:379-1020(+)
MECRLWRLGALAVAVLLWCGESALGDEMREVTIGSTIKLQQDRLKIKLHSHEVAYGSGSGQQSVTGFSGGDDANDYWVVKCAKNVQCHQGMRITNGGTVRLQHMHTRKWLHSHLHSSPLSNNYEVSGFGGDEQTDTGDLWRIEIEGKTSSDAWLRDQKVRLQHVDTNSYLHSHDKKYNRPIAGQYEVCALSRKSPDNIWVATEGVYFPVQESK